MKQKFDLGEFVIKYDPVAPDPRFFETATEMRSASTATLWPQPVPWPPGTAPVADPPATSPHPTDPLPQVDVLLVTWTAGEARALAELFTPGAQLEQWSKYDHNLESFIPKVTGKKAPFNDPKLALYYHHLGLYNFCRIGAVRVLCFKSGLHFAYDGPAIPVADLWNQILDETKARLVITTGTGGGIGANVDLGDAVIASDTVFDCTDPSKFGNAPFKNASYAASALPQNPVADVTPAMMQPNAAVLAGARKLPAPLQFLYAGSPVAASPKIVTTDTFAYDDTSNAAGLQGLGNVCDMGDAVLGMVMSGRQAAPTWTAIRNVSDPQMDGNLPQPARDQDARAIYVKYQMITTVSSVLAGWGIIRKTAPAGAPIAQVAAAVRMLVARPRLVPQRTPSDVLMEVVAGRGLSSQDATKAEVPRPTLDRLNGELKSVNVSLSDSDVTYRLLKYTDELNAPHVLYLAQVSLEDPEAFRGSYLLEGCELVAKREYVSS
jgi:hypothetical protein